MNIKDLEFKPHPACPDGSVARHMFKNGFGVSVITGSVFYTRDDAPYEIAVIDKDGITYETRITNDVLGYLSEENANKVIAEVEALDPVEVPNNQPSD